MAILTPYDFGTIYKHTPKTIKEALQQAKVLFPTLPPSTLQRTHPLPPLEQPTPSNNSQYPNTHTQSTLGRAIHIITKVKTITMKDKWGVQAIKRTYLCQWQSTQGTTQQWRSEEGLLHPDNTLLKHNLLLITQHDRKILEQKTTQQYTKHLNHSQSKDKKIHASTPQNNQCQNIHTRV